MCCVSDSLENKKKQKKRRKNVLQRKSTTVFFQNVIIIWKKVFFFLSCTYREILLFFVRISQKKKIVLVKNHNIIIVSSSEKALEWKLLYHRIIENFFPLSIFVSIWMPHERKFCVYMCIIQFMWGRYIRWEKQENYAEYYFFCVLQNKIK